MGRAYVFLTSRLDRAVQDPADFSVPEVPTGIYGAGSSMTLSLKLNKSQTFGMLSPADHSQTGGWEQDRTQGSPWSDVPTEPLTPEWDQPH